MLYNRRIAFALGNLRTEHMMMCDALRESETKSSLQSLMIHGQYNCSAIFFPDSIVGMPSSKIDWRVDSCWATRWEGFPWFSWMKEKGDPQSSPCYPLLGGLSATLRGRPGEAGRLGVGDPSRWPFWGDDQLGDLYISLWQSHFRGWVHQSWEWECRGMIVGCSGNMMGYDHQQYDRWEIV